MAGQKMRFYFVGPKNSITEIKSVKRGLHFLPIITRKTYFDNQKFFIVQINFYLAA